MKNFNADSICGCERLMLPSGLKVVVRYMPQFNSIHAEFTTAFGSIFDCFSINGKTVELPAGVAHFLEHKMFENEEADAFTLFAKTGAQANAYTSFDKTCYLFTATENYRESLDILLNMVNRPYFTKETIAKEQGIIGQEIKMYDDNPDWRLIVSLCEGMYFNHGIRNDIAGSVESIAKITPQMLYDCTDAFYSPANMVLAVSGNITLNEVVDACKAAGLYNRDKSFDGKVIWAEEPVHVKRPYYEFSMPVAKPCFGLGYKETAPKIADVKSEAICDLLSEVICGDMTPLYRKLYDQNLVNPDFGCEYLFLPGCCCFLFTGESEDPDTVISLIKDEIVRVRRDGIDEEIFALCKNRIYGEFVKRMESVDDCCSDLMSCELKGRTPQQELEALTNITKQEVEAALAGMLQDQFSTVVKIVPQIGDERE